MSEPKRNNKSETRVSNIEWKSTLEDTGQQNHDIISGSGSGYRLTLTTNY